MANGNHIDVNKIEKIPTINSFAKKYEHKCNVIHYAAVLHSPSLVGQLQ